MSHLSVWKPFFKYKNLVFSGEQEKIYYLCKNGIDKSVPHDHRLLSHNKARDAKR